MDLTRSFASTLVLAAALQAHALDVAVEPPAPTYTDRVTIVIRDCAQPGVLHWGVNAVGDHWKQAIEPYRPAGSVMDGVATRTPLEGPDAEGVCRVTLGPFADTNQPVHAVTFVVQWQDGGWSNNGGRNYTVPISSARISIEPAAPTMNDRVTVRVHRSRPGGQLRWGVNAVDGAWTEPAPEYRPRGSVLSGDGLAIDTPISAPDRDGTSTVVLGPFNQATQVIRSIHLAVHWGDDWDTDGSRNYNHAIRRSAGPDDPSVSILAVTNGAVLSGAPVARLVATNADVAELRLDGRTVASAWDGAAELAVRLEGLAIGRHRLAAHAARKGRADAEQVEFWCVPELEPAPVPEHATWGATVRDGVATFALHAPGLKFVSVAGDFNGWDEQSHLMRPSPEGTWWLQVPLSNGAYRYQYCIEGERRVADPCAHAVEWKDAKGRASWRPEHAKSVIVVGEEPFAWQAAGYRRPSLENLSIYEFFIEDVAPGKGYRGVVERLDYIRDLGFTAIEPLPVTEFPGDRGWGYNVAFHLAPESSYGSPDDLRYLIDEAHKRGLAFIGDMVFNHMDRNSALWQLYRDDYETSPYFREFHGENWGFPDVEQASPALKAYIALALRHWVESYRIDGFRYDATRFAEWSGYNDWGASWFAWAAKQADPASIQIAEHMPSDPELVNVTEIDTTWDEQFRWRLREMMARGHVDREVFARVIQPALYGYTNDLGRIAYTESHDEERMILEMLENGYSKEEAFRRAQAALVLTLTAPGAAMVYSGQEFGESTKRVVGPNPLHWNLLERRNGRMLADTTRAMNALRTGLGPATIIDGLPGQVAGYRRGHSNGEVVVLVNFGKEAASVTLDLDAARCWRDELEKEAVAPGPYRRTLEPGAPLVLQSKACIPN
jgi:1,4-alpha-glucan branching enzyme